MSLQHIQKNSPRLLPKPAKFEKNPPNGYRVIRKTKCGAGGAAGAGGAGSSPIHKQASLAGRLMKFTKNIWEPVIENVIILDHLMADTSSKRQKIYIFCKICHIFTLYCAKMIFTYLTISRESHFQLQVLSHVPRVNNFSVH